MDGTMAVWIPIPTPHSNYYTDNGWTNDECGLNWLKTNFAKHCPPSKPAQQDSFFATITLPMIPMSSLSTALTTILYYSFLPMLHMFYNLLMLVFLNLWIDTVVKRLIIGWQDNHFMQRYTKMTLSLYVSGLGRRGSRKKTSKLPGRSSFQLAASPGQPTPPSDRNSEPLPACRTQESTWTKTCIS
jgi:hypothetical protein